MFHYTAVENSTGHQLRNGEGEALALFEFRGGKELDKLPVTLAQKISSHPHVLQTACVVVKTLKTKVCVTGARPDVPVENYHPKLFLLSLLDLLAFWTNAIF